MMTVLRMHILLFSILLGGPLSGQSQSEDSIAPWQFRTNGYLKSMQSAIAVSPNPLIYDGLLHHRLNAQLQYRKDLSFQLGWRNRVFLGQSLQFPGYLDQVRIGQSDWLDLSFDLNGTDGIGALSEIDRLYVDYQTQGWQIRLGRQRINWGINTLWNPNDIFNTFAFTDFDYEERPGADAALVKKHWGFASSLEIAFAPQTHWRDGTLGLRFATNTAGYDWQVILGKYRQNLVAGGGWAGSVGNVGLKGEFSYFHPWEETDEENGLSATVSSEYIFSSGWMLSGGVLYNSFGDQSSGLEELFNTQISPKNLYPFTNAIFIQTGLSPHPLLQVNGALIYSGHRTHPIFFTPTVTYSIATNWDLDLIGQLGSLENQGKYELNLSAFFLRLKWSY